MKFMKDFYLKKFAEAVELGDEKMMDEMNRKHTRLVRQREANNVAWVMFVFVMIVVFYPIIHWWLIGWRY